MAIRRQPSAIPRRFRPYLRSAQAAAELQYGGQQGLLQMLLGEESHTLQRSIAQARGGSRVLQAGLDRSRASLDQNLAAAGLDPKALAGTPDGRRVSQTYAGALNELDLRRQQADEYAVSGVRRARDTYSDNFGKLASQLTQLARERGIYTANAYDQMVEGDRNARRSARAEIRKQEFEAGQNALDRATDIDQSLISQNIDPGTGRRLNPDKNPGGESRFSAASTKSAIKEFSQARPAIERLDALGRQGKLTNDARKNSQLARDAKARRAFIANALLQGDQAANLPGIDPWALSAALDMFFDGHVSPATVRKLHDAQVRVRKLPGVRTRQDVGVPTRTQPARRQSRGGPAGP